MEQLGGLFISLRPKQWLKNLLVFMPAAFTIGQYWEPSHWAETRWVLARAGLGFLLFCALSGAEYLINDILDLSRDRLHPEKRKRPLASGKVSRSTALVAASLLIAVSLPLSFALEPGFGIIALGYTALALAYSLAFKHLVIIDVLAVAAGFVLRAAGGAVVIEVPISPWLYVVTVLLALYISLAKRRQELLAVPENPGGHRLTLERYTPQLLDEMMGIVSPATLIAYSLYTFTAENLPQNHSMMLTIPFVLYGVFRYHYLIHTKEMGGSPEDVLLKDWPLMAAVVLWLMASVTILLLYR